MHYKSSKWDDAVDYAEKTLEITRKVPRAYVTLVEATFQKTVRYEKPLEIIEEGLRENPESTDLWVKKGEFSYSDDIYGFGKAYEKAISLNPNDCKIYREYIYLLLMCEDDEAAKKQYNQMILYHPLFEKSFEELKKSWFI